MRDIRLKAFDMFLQKPMPARGRQWGQDENRHEDDLPEKGE
jgi:hypothetical protein